MKLETEWYVFGVKKTLRCDKGIFGEMAEVGL